MTLHKIIITHIAFYNYKKILFKQFKHMMHNLVLITLNWLFKTLGRYNRNVQQRSFNIGDLVLRRIQDETGLHKLNFRWEGPFIVTKVTRPGSYRITDADGNEVLNSWNIEHLRKFFP